MKSELGREREDPREESRRKLLELLCEVYGGKEKMQAMGDEEIFLYYYIGVAPGVLELRITISTEGEPKTTIFQVEAIEKLIKERMSFIINRKDPAYRNALYTTYFNRFLISKIPELLDKTP